MSSELLGLEERLQKLLPEKLDPNWFKLLKIEDTTTLIKDEETPFKAARECSEVRIECLSHTDKDVVIKVLLPYSEAIELSEANDFELGVRLAKYLVASVNAIKQHKVLLSGGILTIKRPDGSILTDCSSVAAYELRMFYSERA